MNTQTTNSAKLLEDKKKEKEEENERAWGDSNLKKEYSLWDFTKFVLPFLWRGGGWIKFQTVIIFFMMICAKLLTVTYPIFLKYAVDGITCQSDSITGCPSNSEIYMYIIMYGSIKFCGDFINYVREVPFSNVAASAESYIANMIYKHTQDQSMGFHLSRETGKIIRIVSRGSQSFANILRYATFNIIPTILEIIFTLTIISVLFPFQFFMIASAVIFSYITLTLAITEWRASSFKRQATADTRYVQKATDSLLNFETVKYFNAEDHEQGRFALALMEYKKMSISVARGLVVLNLCQAFVIASGLIAMLSYGYSQYVEGTLAVGDFVMLNSYIIQMFIPMGILGTMWRFIRAAMVDVEMVFELLEVDDIIKDPSNPLPPQVTKGVIEFKNVSFSYDKDVPIDQRKLIIDNLSFQVPAGKSVAIVGSTGSGKSTIMRLLYRFYDLDEGQILIDGQDITQMRVNDLRQNIAIVPQDCVLFNDTLMYNIGYGGVRDPQLKELLDEEDTRSQELIDAIIPAAKRAQIHNFVIQKAKGYFEQVGERGLKLSGGEKQRVAIARALLKKTPIMCFDEATSALDTETEREIQKAINEVSKGSTTLMIAHRLSTVKDCDIIIVLKHGVIVEQGNHEELLQVDDGHYRKLWEKQSEQSEREKKLQEEEAKEKLELERTLSERQRNRSFKRSQSRNTKDDDDDGNVPVFRNQRFRIN